MKFFFHLATAACILGHFNEALTGAEVSGIRPELVFVDDGETPSEIVTLLNTSPAGESIRLIDSRGSRFDLWRPIPRTSRVWHPRFICSQNTTKSELPRLDVPQSRQSGSRAIDLHR